MMFQSAPAQLSGRYAGNLDDVDKAIKFQSAPAQLSGRYKLASKGARLTYGFNPRPPN